MKIIYAVKDGLKKAFNTILMMSKIVIPVYFFVKILEYASILNVISKFFSPLMKLFGLPGGAAIVIITGNFLNLYGGIAAMSAFDFSNREITIIALMLLFSHSLPLETSIIKKLNISRSKQILIRVCTMFIIGILLNIIW